MSEIARETGLSRESLFRALNGDENPDVGALAKVLEALGVKLGASAAA